MDINKNIGEFTMIKNFNGILFVAPCGIYGYNYTEKDVVKILKAEGFKIQENHDLGTDETTREMTCGFTYEPEEIKISICPGANDPAIVPIIIKILNNWGYNCRLISKINPVSEIFKRPRTIVTEVFKRPRIFFQKEIESIRNEYNN